MDRDYGKAEECGWCGFTFNPDEMAGCPACEHWLALEGATVIVDPDSEAALWLEGVDPITGDDL